MDSKEIRAAVEAAGVDMPRFESCIGSDTLAQVGRDLELGKKLGVTGTPAFFVGTVLPSGQLKVSHAIPGAVPTDEFRKAINTALDKQGLGQRVREFLGL